MAAMQNHFDVAILGGGLVGAIAAQTLRQRGLGVVVLEARAEGRPQKVVVGEAITEGTSLFLRHELGLGDWLAAHSYRKFGFDFVTLPGDSDGHPPRSIEDCHELLLSQAPLEQIPHAYNRLIPTYHVERPELNEHVAALARQAGAEWRYSAAVEHVALGDGDAPHTVHYSTAGDQRTLGSRRDNSAYAVKEASLTARFVIDASGRKCLLGRQLAIHHKVDVPNTAAVWNRFEGVNADPSAWRSFRGIDRRRHTIHFTGRGFWIWWIHQADDCTSIGVTWDKDQHAPNVKSEDHGFGEMIAKFPFLHDLIGDARAKEPYQYLAHLPYRSDHWISDRRYALLGDAGWFTDALYSIGLETACRQTVLLAHTLAEDHAGRPASRTWVDTLNTHFDYLCTSVARMNEFKYKHAWHHPYLLAQTVLYETAEIGPLYQVADRADWTFAKQRMHYGIGWNSQKRMDALDRFLAESLADADRPLHPRARLLKKALLPGRAVYTATFPLWRVRRWTHWFFRMIRAWGYSERLSQRHRLWPDVLSRMAMGPGQMAGALLRRVTGRAPSNADAPRRHTGV
ncbi:MAG: hypothetical protein EXR72_18035 [Myxococcales bacterium]|nr:hypothetical protein [Myxococcales bacterium]